MATPTCTVTVNLAKYRRLLDGATGSALDVLGEQVLADSNEYVKRDQGPLQESGRFDVNGQRLEISYNTPYANRQYFTGRPSTDQNPRASLMWIHKAQRLHGPDWLAILQKAFSGGLR